MKIQSEIAFALMVLALTALLGSGFFLPRISAYVPIVAGAVILFFAAAVLNWRSFNIVRAAGLVVLCGGPILLSGLINNSPPAKLVSPAAFLAYGVAAYWVGKSMRPDDLRRASIAASGLSVALMLLAIPARHWDIIGAIRTGNRFFADVDQLVTGMNPTVIGLMAMAVFVAALSAENVIFTAAVFLATGLLVMAVSSRSALMTMFVALGASRYLMRRRSAGTIVVGALGAAVLVLIGLLFFGEKLQAAADTLFLVSDQHRGLGSGGSGRAMIWSFFYRNWLNNPIFGSGPGTAFGSGSSALYSHNMLLQILTDGGLVSLVSFLIVLTVAFRSATRVPAPERRVFLTSLLAYLVYGIFEGRAINIGNPMSAYFYFVMFATLGMAEGRVAVNSPKARVNFGKWSGRGFSVAPPTERRFGFAARGRSL